jgi:hypothetical protein
MPDERGHLLVVERGEFVLATYREIATHFHLSGPNAARTKTKRAGWRAEPTNHPANPLRIRVPQDAWSRAAETRPAKRSEGLDLTLDRDATSRRSESPTSKRDERLHPAGIDARSPAPESRHLRALEGHISSLQENLAAERAARIAAEAQRDLALADLRTEREQRATVVARLQTLLDQASADFRTERSRAERAEAGRDGERTRADALRDRLDASQDELRQVREAADQVRQHAREAEDAMAELRQAEAGRKARGRWARLRAAWRGE